jgi:hypothetical protein
MKKVVVVVLIAVVLIALSFVATASAYSEDFKHPSREAQEWADKNTRAPTNFYLSLIGIGIGIGIAGGIIFQYLHKKK